MAAMFEAAYKKFPQNEEYGAQAFMANVRLGNWKGAQQVRIHGYYSSGHCFSHTYLHSLLS
jgi:N-terminal acetyltransferase B complex non-catalytic subunit